MGRILFVFCRSITVVFLLFFVCTLYPLCGISQGTVVLAAEGYVPIEQIKPGTSIISYDTQQGKPVVDIVTTIIEYPADHAKGLIKVVYGAQEFYCNCDQLIYMPGSNEWVKAQDLAHRTDSDQDIAAYEVTSLNDIDITLYGLRTRHLHNFFITPESLLVHNFVVIDDIGLLIGAIVAFVAENFTISIGFSFFGVALQKTFSKGKSTISQIGFGNRTIFDSSLHEQSSPAQGAYHCYQESTLISLGRCEEIYDHKSIAYIHTRDDYGPDGTIIKVPVRSECSGDMPEEKTHTGHTDPPVQDDKTAGGCQLGDPLPEWKNPGFPAVKPESGTIIDYIPPKINTDTLCIIKPGMSELQASLFANVGTAKQGNRPRIRDLEPVKKLLGGCKPGDQTKGKATQFDLATFL